MVAIEVRQADGIALARLERGDGELLRRFFDRLSAETIYRRFFSPLARPEQARPERLLDLDQRDRVALVGLDRDEIVGVARYFRLADDSAEIAVVVADAWQRQGIGSRLLATLADEARRADIHRFRANVQADNRPARDLLRSFDPSARFAFSGGVLETTLELPQPSSEDGRLAEPWSLECRFRALRMVPELSRFSDPELRALLPFVDEAIVPRGATLASLGRPCREFVIVAEGCLSVVASGSRTRLETGGAAGFAAMLERTDNPATIVAEATTRVLVMGHAQFRAVRALLKPAPPSGSRLPAWR
jgi:RimJ/RimL family protein N-acetyltransferase